MTTPTNPLRAAKLRIVLANASLAQYPQGGGHWAVFLQYLFGLEALGHEVFWLELLEPSGNQTRDHHFIRIFLRRLQRYGFGARCAVLLLDRDLSTATFQAAEAHGMNKSRIQDTTATADLVWNFCCALRPPFLALFKRRALVDLDPGMIQLPVLDRGYAIADHDTLLTIGGKIGEPDCEVPTLGREWHRFLPFVHLPLWQAAPDPGRQAAFSSVTQWTWEEYWHEQRLLSFSKRSAYLQYLEVAQKTGRVFELAANIHPRETTGDRELILKAGWRLANPNWVARSPARYQDYIRRSRAEFCCPKPFYKDLNTGWFSDRSVAYLASGRPVLAEDTGFSAQIPTGRGLLSFKDLPEAVAGVHEIDGNYGAHQRAARELAEEYFSSDRWLPRMLSACGW